jgi:D-amino-acid dehydrogenase
MALERGYHMHYAAPEGTGLGRPIHDSAGGYVLTPMEQGLRLCTGVELNDLNAPPDPAPLERAEASAGQAFALGPRLDREPWLGRRPTLPDSVPVIGPAPRHPGVWLAFGHQHIGFSTGPGTARVLGALMSQATAPIDAAPFRPERWVR